MEKGSQFKRIIVEYILKPFQTSRSQAEGYGSSPYLTLHERKPERFSPHFIIKKSEVLVRVYCFSPSKIQRFYQAQNVFQHLV